MSAVFRVKLVGGNVSRRGAKYIVTSSVFSYNQSFLPSLIRIYSKGKIYHEESFRNESKGGVISL